MNRVRKYGAKKSTRKTNAYTVRDDGVYFDVRGRDGRVKIVFIVDHDDIEKVLEYCWNLNPEYGYIQTKTRGGMDNSVGLFLHRHIMNAQVGDLVDHINRVKPDCRKDNLRIATLSQNLHNTGKQKNNTSGVKGVSFVRRSDRSTPYWQASININRKKLSKNFPTFAEALSQRQTWEAEYEPSGLEV